MLITDRGRWKTYIAALLLPTVILHGGPSFWYLRQGHQRRPDRKPRHPATNRALPDAIPKAYPDAAGQARPDLQPDQWAILLQQDADPVKSSIQSKKVSYRWRSVTKRIWLISTARGGDLRRTRSSRRMRSRRMLRLFRHRRSAVCLHGLLRDQRLRGEQHQWIRTGATMA